MPYLKKFNSSLTAVRMLEDRSADALRKVILENFNMSLGNGLGKVADKVFFRICGISTI